MQLLKLQESLRFLLPGVVCPEKTTSSLDSLVLAIRMWVTEFGNVSEREGAGFSTQVLRQDWALCSRFILTNNMWENILIRSWA